MVYKGHVKNGVVVFDRPVDLQEGDEVSVRLAAKSRQSEKRRKRARTLYERLKPVIGIVSGLPSDLARNHDHYLYGTPKK